MTTEYNNDDFWARYHDYAEDSSEAHLTAFYAVYSATNPYGKGSAFDIGCGVVQLMRKVLHNKTYVGFDQHAYESRPDLVQVDYTTDAGRKTIADFARVLEPDVIVSAFSTEIMLPERDRLELYDWLLTLAPQVVASGFYYDDDRRERERVQETHDLWSYQTLLDTPLQPYERRFVQRNPSKLFGPDVVEVWRGFARP